MLFGFDAEDLFVRVDFSRRAGDLLVGAGEVRVTFMKPADTRARIRHQSAGTEARLERRTDGSEWAALAGTPRASAHEVLEVAVPFADLGVSAGDVLTFFVSLHRNGQELERHPSHGPVELRCRPRSSKPELDGLTRAWDDELFRDPFSALRTQPRGRSIRRPKKSRCHVPDGPGGHRDRTRCDPSGRTAGLASAPTNADRNLATRVPRTASANLRAVD